MAESQTDARRLAMWSGPRNVSTALLRSWENRPDTAVCDEPLYAHYLKATGRAHPGAQEVIAHHETDWRKVVNFLTGDVPDGKPIFYQKHMTHHLLPDMDRSWLLSLTNCFLIRDPAEVIASYVRVEAAPRLEDLGLPQQWEIFAGVRDHTGQTPAVIDARDLLQNPRRILGLLCEACGVPFHEGMLSWPPGRRATDGVWAKYWYAGVERSTGFEPYRPSAEPLPEGLRPLERACLEYYGRLYGHRLC